MLTLCSCCYFAKFVENIEQGFKRTISWNSYRPEIITQHSKNCADDPIRNSFYDYYTILVEIKYFNVLIDNKPFFDQSAKSKNEAYEKLIEMSRNDGYTIGNLLNFWYHQNYF